MSNEIQSFKKNVKGKRVAVIGIGVSNTPLIKYLASNGAIVTACDKKESKQIKNINDLKIYVKEFSLGEKYLDNLNGFDYIFRTPGMRYDKPELVEAKKNGAVITSQLELFLELCPCKIIGITGSDGKSTTTTLIYKLLKEAGHKVWLGGNIGIPLIDKINQMNDKDIVVLELSSFQLHTFKRSPQISIITNISPNHLDYHTSYQEYIDAKRNIFKHQDKSNKLIINFDNSVTKKLNQEANGEVVYFSRINDIDEGILLKDNFIVSRKNGMDTQIINATDIKIPGVHNVENYMAAIAAVEGMVSIHDIVKVATTFEGVEHRIEFVREVNGVKFYNDSVASSPTRTIATINSFNQKVILIAGGKNKGLDYTELGKYLLDRVKILLLIGLTTPVIEESLLKECDKQNIECSIPIYKPNTFEETIRKAFELAESGDIVLMSNASTSFDMFNNFAERGKIFKEIVNSL